MGCLRQLHILLVMAISFSFAFANPSNLTEAKNTYCKIPPFLQENIFANLMLVIDLSGSMKYDAYYDNYDSTKTFKGVFDYDSYYACYNVFSGTYDNNVDKCNSYFNRRTWKWVDRYWVKIADNICSADDSSPCLKERNFTVSSRTITARSGNWLNWDKLVRMDIIRWVLTGGNTITIDGEKVVQLYYKENIKASDTTSYNLETGEVEGILQKIQSLKNRPRIGAYFFTDYTGDYIVDKVAPSYDYTTLITKINSAEGGGYTPTGPALRDVLRYFSRQNGEEGGFVINSSNDPYTFEVNDNSVEIRCAKNYVLLLTDGEWNRGEDPMYPAYDMWKGGHADLVSDLDGNQNAKIYTVALFMTDGAGKNAVKHIAIFGGFTDIDDNEMPCGYSSLPSSSKNSVVDITNPAYSSCRNEWDAEPQDGLPDTFASGSNPERVREALNEIFQAILADISSGSSISVLSEKESKSSILVHAVFSPQRYINGYKIKWTGQLFSYWFYNSIKAQNIREDTVQDKKLKLTDDNILKFKTDLTTGKLSIDVYTSNDIGEQQNKIGTYFSLDNIKYLWEAGEVLKNTDANDRIIYAVNDLGSMEEFTVSNADDFQNKLGTNSSHFPECLKRGSSIDYERLIRYIRGEDFPGCRSRKVANTGDNAGDIWKLGDIIYSTPTIVKYDDYSVVYTASNDGILHAFKLGKVNELNSSEYKAELTGTNLGKELWGFIPSTSLTFLRYLADPDYCHMYIHDLSPYVINVDYDKDGTDETVLIGGLRLGGGCECDGEHCVKPPSDRLDAYSQYYALDITDPTNPVLLWEFKHPDLGFAYSGPGIIKAKDENYYVVFASGPTSYSAQFDNSVNRTLKIFILNLTTGSLERIIDTEINKAFAGRIFSQGYDLNSNGYTDFLVFGYTRQDGADTNYKGGLIFLVGETIDNRIYPLDSKNSPDEWTFANITSLGTDIPPVTAKVELEKCFNKWYMFLGTGRWFEKDDNWEVQPTNILFGIPIRPDTFSGVAWDYSNYQYIEILTNTQDVTNIEHVNNICIDRNHGVIRGWYLRLDSASGDFLKEKAISNPSATDKNIVFFPTIFPSNDYCDYGGKTRVWILNCATGDAIKSDRCPEYAININKFDFLLQLSGGDIQEITENSLISGQRATEKMSGIASEGGGVPLIPSLSKGKGEIILWIEK